MRFLRRHKAKKTILVISDIHLGAGTYVKGMKNYLEDFHYDKEMVDFVEYYSSGDFEKREVELIINGDLFDLLAVPFVEYFDDEFWSEDAALEKLKMIIEAHPEVMAAYQDFLTKKNKKIVFIVGNHDGELVLKKLQEYLLSQFTEETRENFVILSEGSGEYLPHRGVLIKHGHEYEIAHQFDLKQSIISDEEGKRYFLPPWGSYYVTRVINKFKEERGHINAVRPIKKAMINGLIYDTVFTIRFILANIFYFAMVRFIYFFKQGNSLAKIFEHSAGELELFGDYEELTRDVFERDEGVHCLIVGHTHEPIHRTYSDGNTFINTGTWTDMYHLDWGKRTTGPQLTYAQLNIYENEERPEIALRSWEGVNELPFTEL
jgi:UDP-2,3-diacylglucosamine pyrophosphatase LpxH